MTTPMDDVAKIADDLGSHEKKVFRSAVSVAWDRRLWCHIDNPLCLSWRKKGYVSAFDNDLQIAALSPLGQAVHTYLMENNNG